MTRDAKPAVDWERVEAMTMAAFLEQYTLHDASFQGLHLDWDGKTIVSIHMDPVWNKRLPPGFDQLQIRFDRVYRVRWVQGSWAQSTLAGADSTALDAAARAALMDDVDFRCEAYQGTKDEIPHPADDENVASTRFGWVNWSQLEILHGGSVHCAIGNHEGNWRDIAAVDSATGS